MSAMKVLRPLISRTEKSSNSVFGRSGVAPAEPSSFGERRAQEMSSRLQKAQADRQKLIRAEYATDNQAKIVVQQKREMADRTISRLSALEKNTEE